MSKNNQFLDSSPSKDFYNDDSEMISLLNNMWGSGSNNIVISKEGNNKRSFSLGKQTPLKSPNSRQPSIPTLPIHHLNLNQPLDSQLIFLDSPNFDSFITFTPNQIQPAATKLFSNQKLQQQQHQQQFQPQQIQFAQKQFPPQQHQQQPMQQLSQQPQSAKQYLPVENLISISPSLRTPLANKSNIEDLFDTPYLNSLYSTFANTTNNDDLANNLSAAANGQVALIQTPLTEKLDKIFKTPTSNDIFNSKQFFGNSTIKRLTNTLNNANNNSKSNPTTSSKSDKPIETDFKNSPCVKHQEKMSVSETLSIVKQSTDLSNPKNFFGMQMNSAGNDYDSSKPKILSEVNITPPKKSKSKSKKKQSQLQQQLPQQPQHIDNNSKGDISNIDHSIDNDDNNNNNNSITIDSSPSTIVVSSASKSLTRLTAGPANKILEASPTPMNKFIDNILSKEQHNTNKHIGSANMKSQLHSHLNINNNDNKIYIPDKNITTTTSTNTTNNNFMIAKAPVMGVFKDQTSNNSKSLRKVKTQPALGFTGTINKPAFASNLMNGKSNNGKKFNRSTSLNDTITSSNHSSKANNKNAKRNRNNGSGSIHFIMADPDQLKGNKKRRVSRKKEGVENEKSQLTKAGDKFVPLKNSTNIVNNRNRTPSPVKGGNKLIMRPQENENNIFWEARN